MTGNNGIPRKPKALAASSRLAVFAPASSADSVEIIAGLAQLKRHGFQVVANQDSKAEGYFAGPPLERVNSFLENVNSTQVDGLVALRGGYGSNYLLDFELEKSLANSKCVIGFSDLTTLQIYL
ncbi:MAG TPA: LD-carboxypeptidase, partial [Candidatus Acidoferrum sp.]